MVEHGRVDRFVRNEIRHNLRVAKICSIFLLLVVGSVLLVYALLIGYGTGFYIADNQGSIAKRYVVTGYYLMTAFVVLAILCHGWMYIIIRWPASRRIARKAVWLSLGAFVVCLPALILLLVIGP